MQNLKNLERLSLEGPDYKKTEFDISWMERLVNLQELELSGFKIVNVGPLLKLQHLAKINVMFSEISDENIKLLRTTNALIITADYNDR
jgi:Leucine-rich repeat (LRR) protein